MKLLSVKKNEEHITFHFKSKTRVDFRSLVKELNSHFNTRVELRQVEGREASEVLGGIGRCGRRDLCCKRWEPAFPKVTAKMIKELGLEGSPSQYIGACGRLMCCLAFELKDLKFPERQAPERLKIKRCQECGRNLDHTHIEVPVVEEKEEEPKEKKPPVRRIRRILK